MSITRLAPLLLLLATACSPIALSPALRSVPLETAATAREGHVVMRGGAGYHGGWGAEVTTASGGAGIGVAQDVELQVEGNFAYDDTIAHGTRSLSPFVGAGRIGIKHRLLDCLAVTGGVGAGSGPWGAFGGGDLGVILAYENPYVIPFFAARMQLSLPINAQTETFVDTNGSGTTTTFLTPNATFWFQPSTGVRVPLCWNDGCDGTRVSLVLAVAWTQIAQVNAPHDGGAFGVEGGILIEP
jgi:hypothetical protein